MPLALCHSLATTPIHIRLPQFRIAQLPPQRDRRRPRRAAWPARWHRSSAGVRAQCWTRRTRVVRASPRSAEARHAIAAAADEIETELGFDGVIALLEQRAESPRPALLTTTSMRPNVRSAVSTIVAAAFDSVTSNVSVSAAPPASTISLRSRSRRSARRATQRTRNPRAARLTRKLGADTGAGAGNDHDHAARRGLALITLDFAQPVGQSFAAVQPRYAASESTYFAHPVKDAQPDDGSA